MMHGVLICCLPFGSSDAFDFEFGTLVLRMAQGLDISQFVDEEGWYKNILTPLTNIQIYILCMNVYRTINVLLNSIKTICLF